MISIRRSCFETNSSSTHSFTYCCKNGEFDKWKNGDVFYSTDLNRMITGEELAGIFRIYSYENISSVGRVQEDDYEVEFDDFIGDTEITIIKE